MSLEVIDAVIPTSTNSSDTSFHDLKPLKEVLAGKRIVLLGEQTHGEGSTFSAKVRLIKFLHQELDFDLLLFESGFYDNFRANESLKNNNPKEFSLNESVFDIWTDTEEFGDLISYVQQQYGQERPLQVGGFDFQEGDMFQNNFLVELVEILNREQLLPTEASQTIVDQVMHGGLEFLAENQKDSISFFKTCKAYLSGLDELRANNDGIKPMVYKQALVSWIAGHRQMTKKDFFVLTIKLFGLFSLVTSIFSVIPSNISFALMDIDTISIIWIMIAAISIGGMFVLLVFKADKVVQVLKLDKGFDDNRI